MRFSSTQFCITGPVPKGLTVFGTIFYSTPSRLVQHPSSSKGPTRCLTSLDVYLFIFMYLSTFIAHYPRVSSKRFAFIFTSLAFLPG
jgi:hypothetical protein